MDGKYDWAGVKELLDQLSPKEKMEAISELRELTNRKEPFDLRILGSKSSSHVAHAPLMKYFDDIRPYVEEAFQDHVRGFIPYLLTLSLDVVFHFKYVDLVSLIVLLASLYNRSLERGSGDIDKYAIGLLSIAVFMRLVEYAGKFISNFVMAF